MSRSMVIWRLGEYVKESSCIDYGAKQNCLELSRGAKRRPMWHGVLVDCVRETCEVCMALCMVVCVIDGGHASEWRCGRKCDA